MRLQSSPFQPDPHVSFLDVIFCLCVFLVMLVSILMSVKDVAESEAVQKSVEVAQKEVEEQEDMRTTRFRGRGGQPVMKVHVFYDNGLLFHNKSSKHF